MANVKERYDSAAFEAAAGFLRQSDDGTEILIPSQRFQQEFADYRVTMAELRDSGLATTERGKKPKLIISSALAWGGSELTRSPVLSRSIA